MTEEEQNGKVLHAQNAALAAIAELTIILKASEEELMRLRSLPTGEKSNSKT